MYKYRFRAIHVQNCCYADLLLLMYGSESNTRIYIKTAIYYIYSQGPFD